MSVVVGVPTLPSGSLQALKVFHFHSLYRPTFPPRGHRSPTLLISPVAASTNTEVGRPGHTSRLVLTAQASLPPANNLQL